MMSTFSNHSPSRMCISASNWKSRVLLLMDCQTSRVKQCKRRTAECGKGDMTDKAMLIQNGLHFLLGWYKYSCV